MTTTRSKSLFKMHTKCEDGWVKYYHISGDKYRGAIAKMAEGIDREIQRNLISGICIRVKESRSFTKQDQRRESLSVSSHFPKPGSS